MASRDVAAMYGTSSGASTDGNPSPADSSNANHTTAAATESNRSSRNDNTAGIEAPAGFVPSTSTVSSTAPAPSTSMAADGKLVSGFLSYPQQHQQQHRSAVHHSRSNSSDFLLTGLTQESKTNPLYDSSEAINSMGDPFNLPGTADFLHPGHSSLNGSTEALITTTTAAAPTATTGAPATATTAAHTAAPATATATTTASTAASGHADMSAMLDEAVTSAFPSLVAQMHHQQPQHQQQHQHQQQQPLEYQQQHMHDASAAPHTPLQGAMDTEHVVAPPLQPFFPQHASITTTGSSSEPHHTGSGSADGSGGGGGDRESRIEGRSSMFHVLPPPPSPQTSRPGSSALNTHAPEQQPQSQQRHHHQQQYQQQQQQQQRQDADLFAQYGLHWGNARAAGTTHQHQQQYQYQPQHHGAQLPQQHHYGAAASTMAAGATASGGYGLTASSSSATRASTRGGKRRHAATSPTSTGSGGSGSGGSGDKRAHMQQGSAGAATGASRRSSRSSHGNGAGAAAGGGRRAKKSARGSVTETGSGDVPVLEFVVHDDKESCPVLDAERRVMTELTLNVRADKGFAYSPMDEAFVCQKKNHFQLSALVACDTVPHYVQVKGTLMEIESMAVSITGIKLESPHQEVGIEQSQSDRTKAPFQPHRLPLSEMAGRSIHKLARLHFSATTANNMRKRGKPNPDQRYFSLAVSLQANTTTGERVNVQEVRCQRIIVRASNPGQYSSEIDSQWSRGKAPTSVVHHGQVGINVDDPRDALSVAGNVRVTGHVLQTSDQRVKENMVRASTTKHLDNVKRMQLYEYDLKEGWAEKAGRSKDDRHEMGVMAQDLQRVLPDAVRSSGNVTLGDGTEIDNLLVVNKDRVFMESVGAVQELSKMTEHLQLRIHELEELNRNIRQRSLSRRSTRSTRSQASNNSNSNSSSSNDNMNGHVVNKGGVGSRGGSGHGRAGSTKGRDRGHSRNRSVGSNSGSFYGFGADCWDGVEDDAYDSASASHSISRSGSGRRSSRRHSGPRKPYEPTLLSDGLVVYRKRFPFLQLCAWLTVCMLLTAVLAVGVALLIERSDESGGASPSAGNSTTSGSSSTSVLPSLSPSLSPAFSIATSNMHTTATASATSGIIATTMATTSMAQCVPECSEYEECQQGGCVCAYGRNEDGDCYETHAAWCEDNCIVPHTDCSSSSSPSNDCDCTLGWTGFMCALPSASNAYLASVDVLVPPQGSFSVSDAPWSLGRDAYAFVVSSTSTSDAVSVVVATQQFHPNATRVLTQEWTATCDGMVLEQNSNATVLQEESMLRTIGPNSETILNLSVQSEDGLATRMYTITIQRGCPQTTQGTSSHA